MWFAFFIGHVSCRPILAKTEASVNVPPLMTLHEFQSLEAFEPGCGTNSRAVHSQPVQQKSISLVSKSGFLRQLIRNVYESHLTMTVGAKDESHTTQEDSTIFDPNTSIILSLACFLKSLNPSHIRKHSSRNNPNVESLIHLASLSTFDLPPC